MNNSDSNTNTSIGTRSLTLYLAINYWMLQALALAKIHKFKTSCASRLILESLANTHKAEGENLKRYGNLFERIYDYENIKLAHKKAKKDKLFYKEVKIVDANEEYYLIQIQNMLIWKTYEVKSTDYKPFTKMDKGKERDIYKLDYFPHRIIQHALMNVVEDIFLKSFIDNTFASIPGRGIHLALSKLDEALKDKEETTHCFKMDVRKFYPSINQVIAKKQLRKKFKDKDVLWLMDMIIDSMEGEKGVAIGSLFSQWEGNFYLSEFDH